MRELHKFSWVESRRNFIFVKSSNLKISAGFWDLDLIFFMWAQFWCRTNFSIATWGLRQLLYRFPRGGRWAPPPTFFSVSQTLHLIGLREEILKHCKIAQLLWGVASSQHFDVATLQHCIEMLQHCNIMLFQHGNIATTFRGA